MRERNYWTHVFAKRLSRRQALGTAARAGLGLAGLSLLGCAPGAAPGAPAAQLPEQITVAYIVDQINNDAHLDSTIMGVAVQDHIYDGLFKRSASLAIVPALAESHRWLDDPKIWEVKLRKGIKFHNGEPMNAEVVKFNTERQQNADFKPRYISDFKAIKKVEVVDEYTARVYSEAPDPTMPLKYIQTGMVPMKYNQGPTGNKAQSDNPIGTGPYRYVKWFKDDRVEMERNDDWWGWQKGMPWEKAIKGPKKLIYRVIPQSAGRMAALKTGEADVIFGPAMEEIDAIKADPNFTFLPNKSGGSPHIILSVFDKKSPLQDKRVRQALNYAVDMDTIIKKIMKGNPERQASAVGSSYFGFDKDLKPYPYDPKKAKELLAQAGYANGFEVVFDHNDPVCYPGGSEYVPAIAGYLADVGVKAKLTPHAASLQFRETSLAKKDGPYGLIESCRGTSTLDIDFIVNQNIHSKGTRNHGYYNNPEVDKLIDQGRSTVKVEERKAIYKKLLTLIKDEAPWIFMFQVTYDFAYNKKKLPNFNPVMWMATFYNYGPEGDAKV
ncbi:MAG: hypothetical protein HYU86_09500 [Chloroflexi bacterium]|nr:hypothetical protein [Chloroflexota bacterium]